MRHKATTGRDGLPAPNPCHLYTGWVPTSDEPTVPAGRDTLPATVSGPARPPFAVGARISGRYTLETVLGRGGMGTVYRCRDELLDESVALKVLHVDPGAPEAERLRDEVRIARRITHVNVVRTHDIGVHDARVFMTMELVEGPSLQGLLATRRRLDVQEAVKLAIAISDGLAAAHAAGIIHRDLKPANVLMGRCGQAKLTDFGLAAALGTNESPAGGTPLYMSPEQVCGDPLDARSDLYALGLLLFELLAGAPPFARGTAVATMAARLDEPTPRLAVEGIPAGLVDLVQSLLARAPADRPAEAREVADVLSRFLRETSAPSFFPEPAQAVRPARGAPVLAVLPLAVRSGIDLDGCEMASDVIDALGCGREVRVLAETATAGLGPSADPRRTFADLGADLVVQSRIAAHPDGRIVRLSLVDAHTGTQEAKARFSLPDALDEPHALAAQIARRLRFEVLTLLARRRHPAAAVTDFIQAHDLLMGRTAISSPEEAASLLERSLGLAPDFALAAATLATVRLDQWFNPGGAPAEDSEVEAREAVARAVELGDDLPETQVAVARLAIQDGRWRAGAFALRRALAQMPAHPDALSLLGLLEVESGRVEAGFARLARAVAFEPRLPSFDYESARYAALTGDHAGFVHHVGRLEHRVQRLALLALLYREAAWYGRRADLVQVRARLEQSPDPAARLLEAHVDTHLGRMPLARFREISETALAHVGGNPRFEALFLQYETETLALGGDIEGALESLDRAASGRLVDQVWLDRCPALDALRGHRAFAASCEQVRARCAAIWRV